MLNTLYSFSNPFFFCIAWTYLYNLLIGIAFLVGTLAYIFGLETALILPRLALSVPILPMLPWLLLRLLASEVDSETLNHITVKSLLIIGL